MLLSSDIFESIDKSQLVELKKSLQDICFSCDGLDFLCGNCPINESFQAIYSKQELTNSSATYDYNKTFSDLLFEKNKLLLANDYVEQICINCNHKVFLCLKCELHKIKRNLASLPVFEIKNKVLLSSNSINHDKKSCSTSCETTCGVKK